MLNNLKTLVFGAPRNPMERDTRRHISLIAFFAWVGLGADGLSSSAYGPEQAYLALGHHIYFGLYISVMIALTVFVISFAYNQVIELFPSGGGGYKVATRLIGSYPGLISGTALILGYVLTVSISISSGVDALFSLFPIKFQAYKLTVEVGLLLMMMYLNLRGIKESIYIFLPIFLGFVVVHLVIIIYGIFIHINQLPHIVYKATLDTNQIFRSTGLFFIVALLLRAYSSGGATYTGLEAVSNNVNNLAEPRVRTGKWAMFYMAISLSFMASGILLLYLLWQVHPVSGKTLNAAVFGKILHGIPFGHEALIVILVLEAGLLFVGANTGFLGGPAVLANMSIDGWVPRRFRNLSSRLVVQNGIVLFGFAGILVLWLTHGSVAEEVVIYSASVFLTFTLSLFGLCLYWSRRIFRAKRWFYHLLLSVIGFIICFFILLTIITTKFAKGGWLAIVFNCFVIALCICIRRHYHKVEDKVRYLDKMFKFPITPNPEFIRGIDPEQSTAVFFIGNSIGEGMHTLLLARRMFPMKFDNMLFVSVGIIDVDSYESDAALTIMKQTLHKKLQYFIDYARQYSIPARAYYGYGTDPVAELVNISDRISAEFKSVIFFAARVVLKQENWFLRNLHNGTPLLLQRYLHLKGMQMIILPVMLSREKKGMLQTEFR